MKELEIVQGRENILRGVREDTISTKQERKHQAIDWRAPYKISEQYSSKVSRTPTWKASSGAADCAAAAAGGGPGGRAGRRARGLAGERRRGRRLRGAADSSTDSGGGGGGAAPPVVHRAAAPPLPRAGRAGGAVLPGPRPRLPGAAQAGVAPRAAGAPAARPPRRHPSPRRGESLGPGSPRLRRAGLHRPGSPPARPPWEALVSRDNRRGDPARASPGLRATAAPPPARGPRRWAGRSSPGLASQGPGAGGLDRSRSERCGRAGEKEAAARRPPRRRCPAPVLGRRSADLYASRWIKMKLLETWQAKKSEAAAITL
ncbi:basic proline-rich protein-like [Mirounga leonina]|uniref:basic proline-rich protein-like n=1 Tax=Mirounga leonina TaxID=9715 RepID=UPI00156C465A|nr:basic proline-rich protein-like [Mirounga leonina]